MNLQPFTLGTCACQTRLGPSSGGSWRPWLGLSELAAQRWDHRSGVRSFPLGWRGSLRKAGRAGGLALRRRLWGWGRVRVGPLEVLCTLWESSDGPVVLGQLCPGHDFGLSFQPSHSRREQGGGPYTSRMGRWWKGPGPTRQGLEEGRAGWVEGWEEWWNLGPNGPLGRARSHVLVYLDRRPWLLQVYSF